MRVYNNQKNTEFVGVQKIKNEDSAWKLKKLAIFAVMNSLCDLIKK